MKIINNDKKEIFLQIEDILFLYSLELSMSNDIKKVLFANINEYKDLSKDKFIKFNSYDLINFVNGLDFIISWNLYSEYDKEDVLTILRHESITYQSLSNTYNMMSDIDKEYNENILYDLKKINHKIDDLRSIVNYKSGKSNIELPLEPDYYGFKYATTSSDYAINQAIDSNIMLLYRLDNKRIDSLEDIPFNFINTGLCVAAMEGINESYLDGEYDLSYTLSDDKKYIIVRYNKNEKYLDNISNNKGIRGFVNKIFK